MITFKEYYLQEKMTENEKLIALGLASAAALPGTAYLGNKAGEALADKPTPIVQPAQPPTQPPPAVVAGQPVAAPAAPVAAPVAAPPVPGQPANELPANVYTWIFNNETLDRDGDGDRDADLVAYDDGAGNMTIGVGHHLQGTQADRAQLAAVTNTDYDQLVNTTAALTEPEALQLFSNDVDLEYVPAVRNELPNFNTYNAELQAALVDAEYRGDLGDDTVDLINAGADGEQIATEYLNHQGYRTADERGLGGIRVRMDANAAVLRTEFNRLHNNNR